MTAVKAPPAPIVIGADANSLPGKGGVRRMYAYVGDSMLLVHVEVVHGLGADSVVLLTVILNNPECCLTLVTGGVPGGKFTVTLLPEIRLVTTTRIPLRVKVAFSLYVKTAALLAGLNGKSPLGKLNVALDPWDSCDIHSCSRVTVAFSFAPVGFTTVKAPISDTPEVNAPFRMVTLEMYIPFPKLAEGTDTVRGEGAEPLSIATTLPSILPGLVELEP
jgi:hypothetical protein